EQGRPVGSFRSRGETGAGGGGPSIADLAQEGIGGLLGGGLARGAGLQMAGDGIGLDLGQLALAERRQVLGGRVLHGFRHWLLLPATVGIGPGTLRSDTKSAPDPETCQKNVASIDQPFSARSRASRLAAVSIPILAHHRCRV